MIYINRVKKEWLIGWIQLDMPIPRTNRAYLEHVFGLEFNEYRRYKRCINEPRIMVVYVKASIDEAEGVQYEVIGDIKKIDGLIKALEVLGVHEL